MRTLLAKDLRILRALSAPARACWSLYPLVVALLIGLTLSRGPDKPRVAFVNEVPQGETLDVGTRPAAPGSRSTRCAITSSRCEVSSREEAERLVRDGDVLGALIIPEDTFQKIESRRRAARLEVLVERGGPDQGALVDDAIDAARREANRHVARALTRANLRYLDLLLNGGDVNVFGHEFNVLGLRRIGAVGGGGAARAAARISRAPRPRPGGALHTGRAGELRSVEPGARRR